VKTTSPALNRLLKGCLLGLALLSCRGGAGAAAAPGAVELRYTYKADRVTVEPLKDTDGRPWVPLDEVAAFYGVRFQYQPQARRIEMSRGQRRVVAVASQAFALVDGVESFPLEPPETVQGRLCARPEAAAALLRAVLNVQASYLDDKGVLYVGAVSEDDVRREIDAERAGQLPPAPAGALATPNPSAEPTWPGPEPRVQSITPKSVVARIYRIKRIVIDPGHGGRDGGAVGYSGRFYEKTATLDIAKRVAEILRREQDLEVLLTRDKDKYITLQYRTEFANRHQADLFVSVHCNANPRRNARGTEVYIYSSRATGNAMEAAARENAGGDFLPMIEADLWSGTYRTRSKLLAENVDQRIHDRLGQHILRTEQAPFYVLARVKMPSILVETAFITHREEERKLKDPEWRALVAQAIADGVLAYRDKVEDLEDKQATPVTTK